MSETQTLGPCTECGTPRDACTAPGYCCDECLHFPPDWDGYEPPQDAEPTDVRDQIARVYYTWPGDVSLTAERLADAVLALPAVRDALAAQETVRRVEALAEELDGYTQRRGRPAPGSYDYGVNLAQADAAASIRRVLAGEPLTTVGDNGSGDWMGGPIG